MMPDREWLNRPSCDSRDYEWYFLQKERIRIPKFGYHEAFEIGVLANNLSKEVFPNESVVIDISLPNGHCLFRIVTNDDSWLDDDEWIKRNRETAMRYRLSSFIMGLKFYGQLPGYGRSEYSRDPKHYTAFDGGSLPIFAGSHGVPVACLTVSGLNKYKNHWVAVESLRDYVMEVKGSSNQYMTNCAICMSEMRISAEGILKTNSIDGPAQVMTQCNHAFHNRCLKSRIDNHRPDCPVCRSSIPRETWRRLTWKTDVQTDAPNGMNG